MVCYEITFRNKEDLLREITGRKEEATSEKT
jgi:hypothetical protein